MAITVIMSAIFIQYGCHENVLINSKVSPSANAIGITSVNLPVITHTYYSDSTITSTNIGGIPMYQAVGTITDPFFGTMAGATYFQVIPGSSLPYSDSLLSTTTSGNTFDSAVLALPYSGFAYGDTLNTNLTQTYQVFLMTDTLGDPINENYYSNSTKSIDLAHPLSDPYTVNVYHLRDSFGVNVLDQNYAGLRIPLKLPLLLQRLTPAITSININSTTLATDFEGIFNGICVRAADSRQLANILPYFQLDGATDYSTAGIILYYHNPLVDSEQYFPFSFSTQFCSHFNNITRSYSHYPVNNLIQTKETDIVALQNQPGPSIDLVIPGILSIIPKGVVINKAEIQFTLLPAPYNAIYSTTDTLFPPEQLYPTGIASATYPYGIGAGVAYNIADRYPVYSTYPLLMIDGYLHNNIRSINSTPLQIFTVDVPREVMYSIANNNDTIHLHINGTQDFYGAFHMVAGGGNYGVNGTSDTLYRAKLVVTYSKLSN